MSIEIICYNLIINSLNIKAFGGLLGLIVVMAIALFISAGAINYWQGWGFLVVFGGSALAITLYLMKNDPKLLARRVYAGPTAEKEVSQKIIQFIASIGFVGMLVVPALDFRFHLSSVPFYLVLAGDFLVELGFLIIFFVFRQNSFTSAIIEVDKSQKVISTGLYAFVRHPMYMGALFLFVGMSLSLGSLWGMVVYLIILPALLWRLILEEKFLTKNLPGYKEYKNKVKYRLVPLVW